MLVFELAAPAHATCLALDVMIAVAPAAAARALQRCPTALPIPALPNPVYRAGGGPPLPPCCSYSPPPPYPCPYHAHLLQPPDMSHGVV